MQVPCLLDNFCLVKILLTFGNLNQLHQCPVSGFQPSGVSVASGQDLLVSELSAFKSAKGEVRAQIEVGENPKFCLHF